MSNKSYAYDPQGNRHETYLKNGVTTTIDGKRLQSGWTSQTAGGIYKMGDDGKGIKVETHNQYTPQKVVNHVNAKDYSSTPGMVNLDFRNDSDARGSAIRNNLYNNSSINYDINKDDYQYEGTYGNTAPQDVYQMNQRKFHNQEEIEGAFRPDQYKTVKNHSASGREGDPSDTKLYNKMVIRTPDGQYTTVDRGAAQYYADQGFELLAPAKGVFAWDIREALRNDMAGSEWVDDGYNNGSIGMTNPTTGGYASVNARYADKYFDKGYTLDPRSQSINRALQSGIHAATDAANGAIRGGEYNPNNDYGSNFGHDGNGRYAFSGGDGRGSYNMYGNEQINDYNLNFSKAVDNRILHDDAEARKWAEWRLNEYGEGADGYEPSKQYEALMSRQAKGETKKDNKSEVKEVVMPSGNTTYQEGGNFFITKPDGQKAKVNESEYQEYMMLEFGI